MESLQLDHLTSWELRHNFLNFSNLQIKMLSKVIIFSCVLACSLAAPTADAEADPQLLLAGAPYTGAAVVGAAAVAPAAVVPAAVAPAVVAPAVVAPNCEIQHEEIETNVCTPSAKTVCETKTVVAQSVKYEKLCKEVTSKHCANGPVLASGYAGHIIAKREADAEADAQWLGGLGYHAAAVAQPIVQEVPVAHEETITHPCHEVTSEHCLDNPVIEETEVPIEQCHVVNVVDCVPQVQKIAKTVCTPVETKVVKHVAHPFAYHYGK